MRTTGTPWKDGSLQNSSMNCDAFIGAMFQSRKMRDGGGFERR